MYQVSCDNILIHDLQLEDLLLIDPMADLAENSAGSFSFTILPTHSSYDNIKEMKSIISVMDDADEVFCGRVSEVTIDFFNRKKVICEGELAFLNDSVQRPAVWKNINIRQYLKALLDSHNQQTGEVFEVGAVTVTDSNDSIYKYTNWESTLEVIKTDLLDTYGGHLRIRKTNGIRYLDYLEEYPNVNSQIINFGENLLDFTKDIDATDIATAVIPLGAKLEESSVEGLDERLTIKSVNNNVDYVYSPSAVNAHGWIYKTVIWDDVTVASNLKTKGTQYLTQIQFENVSLNVKAVDLHLLDVDIEKIKMLDEIKVISKPNGLDKFFPVTQMKLYLDNPSSNTITLGVKVAIGLTGTAESNNNNIKQWIEKVPSYQSILKDAQDNATQLINSALNGYVVTRPNEILIMNTNDIKTATRVWRWNLNGLGYSKDGYSGTFGTAITMDGGIVADFIVAGTMLADRIRGGMLKLGGMNNVNGSMQIINSSGAVVGQWDKDGINITSGSVNASTIKGGEMLADRIRGGSLILGALNGKSDGSLSVIDRNDFTVLSANKNGVGIGGDYLHYWSDGRDMPFGVGGFNIVERNSSQYGWYYYWESDGTRANGIASGGPWIVWGGWNKNDPDKHENYKFVAFQDGRCKAMSWITGSRAEDKENIIEFTESGLDEIRKTKVYEYDLKDSGHHRTGFVIGDDYDISDKILAEEESGVELYGALAMAYKAIQELEAKVKVLEEKKSWFEKMKEGVKKWLISLKN